MYSVIGRCFRVDITIAYRKSKVFWKTLNQQARPCEQKSKSGYQSGKVTEPNHVLPLTKQQACMSARYM